MTKEIKSRSKDIMTVPDIVDYLGLSGGTVRKLINEANLNTILKRRKGSKMLFFRDDVIKYLRSKKK
jgi:excisionase family DNA binding protein